MNEELSYKYELWNLKDLICHIGTFVNTQDLVNYFLITKMFNENTNKNCHFWRIKLLKEFNYSCGGIYDLITIKECYQLLHKVQTFGISSFQFDLLSTPSSLIEYLHINREKLTLRCEHIFVREEYNYKKCNNIGKRYGKYIFCYGCTKKRSVKLLI